jgi:hypothetical protein
MNKDTEEVALPPVEHVETHGDIVKVDLTTNPIHSLSLFSSPKLSWHSLFSWDRIWFDCSDKSEELRLI